MNNGLQTLQFQHLSVNPANPKDVQGGTQDNGTFETTGSSVTWPQTIFGDGGLSGFDATNPAFRFHTYNDAQVDVNFNNGAPPNWDWIADSFFIPPGNTEARLFYFPIITDPSVHGTMFAGLTHVWRTKDNGGPSQAYLASTATSSRVISPCNAVTGCSSATHPRMGDSRVPRRLRIRAHTALFAAAVPLVGSAVTKSDNSTMWASTTTGRLFISKNADAEPQSTVTFTRLDSLDANTPNRAISSISIDPANPNCAYVSYLSYNELVATTLGDIHPGHVFLVTYDPVAGTGTWTNLEGTGTTIGNQPVNSVAYDNVSGDLYASSDFGVFRLAGANGANPWTMAAPGLPVVTVAGLTINPGARQLLAATHGRGAYQLTLP